MKVKNQKCIRRLSFRALKASRKKNIIAVTAIAVATTADINFLSFIRFYLLK